MTRLGGVLLGVIGLAGCGGGPAVPPYGLDALAEQRFRIEARAETSVDAEPVEVERLADVRLALEKIDGDAVELVLYLERYYLHVEGGPQKESEIAISEKGFVSRGGDGAQELRIEPSDETPSAPSLVALLGRPLSGVTLSENGAQRHGVWHSAEPLLQEVELLSWLLLGLPVLPDGDDVRAWNASREVPAVGRYRLGIELPIRFEREAGVVRATGSAERGDLTLADGFSGRVDLRYDGMSELGPHGQLLRADLEFRLHFDSKEGTAIRSKHHLTIACLDCETVQISPPEPRSN